MAIDIILEGIHTYVSFRQDGQIVGEGVVHYESNGLIGVSAPAALTDTHPAQAVAAQVAQMLNAASMAILLKSADDSAWQTTSAPVEA